MSNPNDTTVYDPKGDSFEMPKANARDLVEHAGWTFSPPKVIEKIVEVPAEEPETEEAEETVEEETTEEAEEVTEEEEAADEAPADETADEAPADETAAPFTSEEDFSALTTREEMVDYLAKHFPDFTPHHKAGRDKLVEKAIELANG